MRVQLDLFFTVSWQQTVTWFYSTHEKSTIQRLLILNLLSISRYHNNVFLDHHDVYTPNITMLSNKMIFEDNGVITGFSEPLVHTYNKGTAAVSMGGYEESE